MAQQRSHANQLSRLIDPLAAAAALAGVDGTDSDTTRLPLCVNVEGHHRRQLWTAWVRRDGRCNRWSALHQLGATIRAYPTSSSTRYTPNPDLSNIGECRSAVVSTGSRTTIPRMPTIDRRASTPGGGKAE